MSITPKCLNKGDKVAIVATARKISLLEILPAIKLFSSWGLEVIVSDTIMKEDNQFAGNDDFRAREMQRFLDDTEIKAIFCARGGYGTVRIIDKLCFKNFIDNPKWIVGYSDPSVLLSDIYHKYKIETIHGIMPFNIRDNHRNSIAITSLKECLFEGKSTLEFEANSLNKEGEAQGDLIGGNLSVLYSLLGSESLGDTKGKILFIEDLDEYLYHIDRMMMCLKRAGKLENLAGLVVGAFSDMHDNTIAFGKNAEEIIFDIVKEYNYPIVFGCPIGHIEQENTAIIHGRSTKLVATKNKIILEQ